MLIKRRRKKLRKLSGMVNRLVHSLHDSFGSFKGGNGLSGFVYVANADFRPSHQNTACSSSVTGLIIKMIKSVTKIGKLSSKQKTPTVVNKPENHMSMVVAPREVTLLLPPQQRLYPQPQLVRGIRRSTNEKPSS